MKNSISASFLVTPLFLALDYSIGVVVYSVLIYEFRNKKVLADHYIGRLLVFMRDVYKYCLEPLCCLLIF